MKQRIRVAVASDDGENVGWGHFAHNMYFLIYEIDGGEAKLTESRQNPFSAVPDLDAAHHGHTPDDHEEHGHELARLHGIEKYSTLRRMVLHDVDLIIASGGCPTSIMYFTGEGVKFIFAEPDTPASKIISSLLKQFNDPDEIPVISTYEGDSIVTD